MMDIWIVIARVIVSIFAIFGAFITVWIIKEMIVDWLKERRRMRNYEYRVKKILKKAAKKIDKYYYNGEMIYFKNGVALVVYKDRDGEGSISFSDYVGKILEDYREDGEGLLYIYGIGKVRIFENESAEVRQK